MTRTHRARRSLFAALTPVLALALAACSTHVPNTIFGAHSEFGHEVDTLTRRLLYAAVIVFVLVEILLVVVLMKFRHREGNTEAQQIHGNTTLEVTWTLIPAVILAFIAVPTVRTIFETQAKAPANALQVEVVGHQWWWEFRYPQYGVVTANELYLPVGRTVNFALKTADVLHSFWPPQLNGKRDLISNHTNYIWFTPDSSYVWNGFCAEYCGASHSNMRFKVFTVPPAEFDAYIQHQKSPPAFGAAPSPQPVTPAGAAATDTTKKATTPTPAPAATAAATAAGAGAPTGTWPRDRVPAWIVPQTPIPAGLTFDEKVTGDPARGAATFKASPCIACHTIQGVSPGVLGPNLTHVGSRTTIAGGFYPNDLKHLRLWIKDAPAMKPGSLMPALGKGMGPTGLYTDQQIADIAAYLQSLK